METQSQHVLPAGRRRFVPVAAGVVLLALLVVAGVAFLAPGAAPSAAASASPSAAASPGTGEKVVLRIGLTEDVDNLNPFVGYNETAWEVFSTNYEYLVERRPSDFMPGPDGIAKSWETSADGKTWTFHLHDNITWQDGQPLTADDVVFTYNYIIDNEMPAYSGTAKGITKAIKLTFRTSRSRYTPPPQLAPAPV